MSINSPQAFARSCGLACVSYFLGIPEKQILSENLDLLNTDKLQFIGLYCFEIQEILKRYGYEYLWVKCDADYSEYLKFQGTFVYIDQIDHYLIRCDDLWADSHLRLRGIPEFGYRNELPYDPSYIIYQPQYR